MKNEWKPIPSLDNKYEVCLVTHQIRNTNTHHIKKLITKGKGDTPYLQYKVNGKPKHKPLPTILLEVSPHYWIYQLNEGEEVKPIKGYPGYWITTWGRVFTTRNKHKFINLHYKPPYYYQLGIYTPDGKSVSTFSHILVGRNYLPEWEEGMCILHKDETLPYPLINHPSNLWVGSKVDNVKDMDGKGRRKPRGKNKPKI